MKQLLTWYIAAAMAVIALCSLVSAKEFMFYKLDRPMVDSDKGFVWMFQNSRSSDFGGVNISDAMKMNWKTPVNYAEGTVHFYIHVKNQPTNTHFDMGFAIFQSKVGAASGSALYYHEISAGHKELKGNGYIKKWSQELPRFMVKEWNGTPAPVDWSRPRYRQSIRFWAYGPPYTELCCSHYNSLKAAYFPLDILFIAVIVEKGGTFSGWDNYVPREPKAPYTANAIPGRIQAEHYDKGGEGFGYHDETPDNKYDVFRYDDVDLQATSDAGSGYKLVASGTEEWTEYTAKTTGGVYDIKVRAATPRTDGNKLTVKVDGNTLGSADIPVTGGWEQFQTITIPGVTVPSASAAKIRLEAEGGGWHLNWIEFVPGDIASVASPEYLSRWDHACPEGYLVRLNGTRVSDGQTGICFKVSGTGIDQVVKKQLIIR